MKQELIFGLIKKLKADPKLMRKLKIALLVGFVGVVLTGTLLIWAGVSALKYVATVTVETAKAPTTQAQIADLTTNLKGLPTDLQSLPKVQLLSCWVTAQRLMDPQLWLARSWTENLNGLKVACIGQGNAEGTSTGTRQDNLENKSQDTQDGDPEEATI